MLKMCCSGRMLGTGEQRRNRRISVAIFSDEGIQVLPKN
jgi:hypothetical protein